MPPMPHMKGSFTICEKAVATAASKALPPFARMAAPTSAARGWGQTTTPFMGNLRVSGSVKLARSARRGTSVRLHGEYHQSTPLRHGGGHVEHRRPEDSRRSQASDHRR